MVRISSTRMDMEDGRIDRPVFKDYGETLVGGASGTNTTATYTVNIENGNTFNLILSANCTFTFSNPTGSGTACSFTLILQQDSTGSRTATWPAAVKWAGGTAPTLTTTAYRYDILQFVTHDGGTTWLSFVSSQDFSTHLRGDFRNSYTSTSDLTTYTFSSADIGTAASDRVVLVGICGSGNQNDTSISSGTIGGVTATVSANVSLSGADTNTGFIHAVVSSGTTGDVVVTFSAAKGRCAIVVWALSGANSTATDTDTATVGISATSISLTALTVPSTGMGFCVVKHNNTSTTGWVWTGATDRADSTIENNTRFSGADTSTDGTNTITATINTSTDKFAMSGVAFDLA